MVKVACIYLPSDDWIGGKNYYLSLFEKLNRTAEYSNNTILIYSNYESDLSELANLKSIEIIRTKILTSKGFWRYLYRVCNKLFGLNSLLYFILKKRKVDILSHGFIPRWTKIKCLPWVPDLQHCLLPENFSKHEVEVRNKNIKMYLEQGNVLFSSFSAVKDAEQFFSTDNTNMWVYRFSPMNSDEVDYAMYQGLLEDNGISEPFVFLPNQFWKHKNHLVCFDACKLARMKGKPFTLVCTGTFSDYRNLYYEKEIRDFISKNNLEEHIKLLGLVPRPVFNCLLKESEVLINPSLFEGWSTTVEEGKLNRKKMVLSDIAVHLEQVQGVPKVWVFKRDSVENCMNQIHSAINSDIVEREKLNRLTGHDINEIYATIAKK